MTKYLSGNEKENRVYVGGCICASAPITVPLDDEFSCPLVY